MHVVFVSKDRGNAAAGVRVARAFRKRGFRVTYLLDYHGGANAAYWGRFDPKSDFRAQFAGLQVKSTLFREEKRAKWFFGDSVSSVEEEFRFLGGTVVFLTLSASGPPNAELDLCREAVRLGFPAYGLEEVIGGRHNPGWGEDQHSPVRCLKRLFTAIPTLEDAEYPNILVVGPPQLAWYRDIDVTAMGAEARRKLGVVEESWLVYYSGQPEPENPHVLSRLGEALASLRADDPSLDVVLVVSRHSRERVQTIPDNNAAHRHALRHIQCRLGIRVIENSLDHKDLLADDPEAIPAEFRPPTFVTYQELVCACKGHGVIVTGFGTDGAVVAPHLGIASILYLDHVHYLFGGLLEREKRLSRLPLPVVPQVATVEALAGELRRLIVPGAVPEWVRNYQYVALSEQYPFPARDPAERIVDLVCEDLAVQPCS